jgi:hypothetical protein
MFKKIITMSYKNEYPTLDDLPEIIAHNKKREMDDYSFSSVGFSGHIYTDPVSDLAFFQILVDLKNLKKSIIDAALADPKNEDRDPNDVTSELLKRAFPTRHCVSVILDQKNYLIHLDPSSNKVFECVTDFLRDKFGTLAIDSEKELDDFERVMTWFENVVKSNDSRLTGSIKFESDEGGKTQTKNEDLTDFYDPLNVRKVVKIEMNFSELATVTIDPYQYLSGAKYHIAPEEPEDPENAEAALNAEMLCCLYVIRKIRGIIQNEI